MASGRDLEDGQTAPAVDLLLVTVVGVDSLLVSVAGSRFIVGVSGSESALVTVAVTSVGVDSLLVSVAGSRLIVVAGD